MYGHIRSHTEEDYPENLPPENAATYVGMHWQWVAQAGLANPAWQAAPETAADFAAMIKGRFSSAQSLLKHMDGMPASDDLNPFGQGFTSYYYNDKEKGYGAFMEDYVRTLDTPSLGSFYYVESSPETHARLAPVFQIAFEKWKNNLVI